MCHVLTCRIFARVIKQSWSNVRLSKKASTFLHIWHIYTLDNTCNTKYITCLTRFQVPWRSRLKPKQGPWCPLVHGAHCRLSEWKPATEASVGVFVAQWLLGGTPAWSTGEKKEDPSKNHRRKKESCKTWPALNADNELTMELLQTFITWIFCYFRPAIKWFLRQTTRLCELQRICYGEAPGAHRTCAVGKSTFYSRHFIDFYAF